MIKSFLCERNYSFYHFINKKFDNERFSYRIVYGGRVEMSAGQRETSSPAFFTRATIFRRAGHLLTENKEIPTIEEQYI